MGPPRRRHGQISPSQPLHGPPIGDTWSFKIGIIHHLQNAPQTHLRIARMAIQPQQHDQKESQGEQWKSSLDPTMAPPSARKDLFTCNLLKSGNCKADLQRIEGILLGPHTVQKYLFIIHTLATLTFHIQ